MSRDDAYYADCTRQSHSMLEVWRSSVSLYYHRFVARTLPAPPGTADMVFGTGFHTMVLTPQTPIPSECEKDRALLERMAHAVLRHEQATLILDRQAHTEKVIEWDDAESRLPCKAKLDLVTDSGLVVDLKTSRDPSAASFARDVVRYGYHRQAAHYLAGAWHALKLDGPFLWIVVGKLPPHEVCLYTPDGEALDLGRRQTDEDLAGVAQALQTGVWESRGARVRQLSLPRWAFCE